MLNRLIIIPALLIAVALLIVSPATFYLIEFGACVSALFFVTFYYLQQRKGAALFSYLMIMLIDYTLVSFAWVNVYFKIMPRYFLIGDFLWILGIITSITFCLLLEFLMTGSVKLTLTKKLIGFLGVGLMLPWLFLPETSNLWLLLEFITFVFNFTVLSLTFWNVIGIADPQKTKIRNDIKYLIGPHLMLCGIGIILYAHFAWIDPNYSHHFRRSEILSGLAAFLILSFLALVVCRNFRCKKSVC